MNAGRRRRLRAVLVGSIVLTACSSGDDTSDDTTAPASVITAASTSTAAPPTGTANATPSTDADPPTATAASSVPGASTTDPGAAVTEAPLPPPTSIVVTMPPVPDLVTLSDTFVDDGEEWDDEAWDVDLPGESSAVVVDGVGLMETDLRGTHEWVRAVAPGSVHEDIMLRVRITPRQTVQGTAFIGVHGDGEWRDRTPYHPQTGVALEYGYSDIYLGELTLIVLDGPDARRVGPVLGPVLAEGESAEIVIEAVDGLVRAKVWRSDDDEPDDWQIEAEAPTDGGVVQLSYRDAPGQSITWDEVSLLLLP